MINFILIFICLVAGMAFRRYGNVPANAHKAINVWLIYIALPAISLKYLPGIKFSSSLLIPAVAPLIVWCGGWLFSYIYTKQNHLPKVTAGSMKLSTGLSNTSFIGFPLVAAYFGEQQIGIAIISDQVTFILLSTAALIVAINASESHKLSFKIALRKLFLFPALPACIIALALPRFVDFTPAYPLFDKLSATVAPLALFSIGLQLDFSNWRAEIKTLTASLIYKLVIAPLLVLIFIIIIKDHSLEAKIGLFESAMATLVSSGIVAAEYKLNTKLSSLIIGFSILLSFVTTALWFYVINLIL